MSLVDYRLTRELPIDDVVRLYGENKWSSADNPDLLLKALLNSESLISAWDKDKLVGLGNAISDGHLVVYYPHLLVLPSYQRQGIGREIMRQLKQKYRDFHQHIIVAEANAFDFYKSAGFSRAGNTISMWVYDGKDH